MLLRSLTRAFRKLACSEGGMMISKVQPSLSVSAENASNRHCTPHTHTLTAQSTVVATMIVVRAIAISIAVIIRTATIKRSRSYPDSLQVGRV